ncbi:MAG: hypothetical protein ACI9W2_000093 [Gammaproteobacteria bacterium]|jgi:hypothetical protein
MTHEATAYLGVWGLAASTVVIAPWLTHRYLAPKTWCEWASAGVVQAFIIARCAQMCGFPFTIYLLARFLGLDRNNPDNLNGLTGRLKVLSSP